ncbi:helix-turn-helix domain-containing protein [Desulfoscipio geothermicus]|uniref:Helix-turn-helix domain-containing protein n=1 Tax=Desulfoscipio geothermicus DSM 3669 TaxID=1121426 RepID=A0A1I6EB48_9FIRM|nr:helix-turn-helix transcriptional regulator [Desulfoscipio geothermicus]SFR14960.1 Helix-turn-helix domain-containing protein [Desulfoscipio geothermicus DSM 3669]
MKMRRFGEILKKTRELRGFSIRDLAKILKVSATLVSKWEIGKYPPPQKIETIKKISQVLAIDENELLELCNIENMLNGLPNNLRVALKKSLYIHLKTNYRDENGRFKGPENIYDSLLPLASNGKNLLVVKQFGFQWDEINYPKFKTLAEWIINDFLMQLLCKISIDFVNIQNGYADIGTFLRNENRKFIIQVYFLKPDGTEELYELDSDGISFSDFLLV